MNLHTKVENLCFVLGNLRALADATRNRENLETVFAAGDWSQDVGEELEKITALNFAEIDSFFRLEIDDIRVHISEFVSNSSGLSRFSWSMTFSKDIFLRVINMSSDDINTLFFTSETGFSENIAAIGLSNPFLESKFLSNKPLKIIVNGLANGFGGPRLAVVSVGGKPDETVWLKGTDLPESDSLKQEINVISEALVHLSPQNFELCWGAIDTDFASVFRVAYFQQLLACLSQHFFSIERIQLKGVKHLECSLMAKRDFSISYEALKDVRDAVIWCYKENDANIRVQLIVDRITLELKDSCNFIEALSPKLKASFDQAKSKYKYVVSKRNEDYRKELRELYSDVKQLVNSYVEKTSSLTDGLIKDVLSIAFIFTVGTFARALTQSDVLLTAQAGFFFKASGVYLLCTYLIRRVQCQFVLTDNYKHLNRWVSEHYTYIPDEDLKKKVDELIKSPRRSFEIMAGVIASLHIVLIVIAFNMSRILEVIGFA